MHKKGKKGFQKTKDAELLKMLKCAWCGQCSKGGVYDKSMLLEKMYEFKMLCPEFDILAETPYLHKTCKTEFMFKANNPRCHACKHRKTITTT